MERLPAVKQDDDFLGDVRRDSGGVLEQAPAPEPALRLCGAQASLLNHAGHFIHKYTGTTEPVALGRDGRARAGTTGGSGAEGRALGVGTGGGQHVECAWESKTGIADQSPTGYVCPACFGGR